MWIRHCNNREVGKMRVRRRDTRIWFMALAVFFAVFLFTFLRQTFSDKDEVEAANLANFDPGYIISDYQMSNFNSMSEAEIQAFLTAKNPCGNTNQANYELLKERYPSISWHFENGHFICLSEELFGDGEVIGEGETAAHIIWQAAQDYQINPQVIVVLLQKEQGLITDDFPNSRQYRSATGYGCPDTAACSSKYYGFKNQVRNAAKMFRAVLDGGWTNYPLGENYIQYNPNAACGGSIVNVQNLATSALYRYTPYQPNEGSLAAGYGTAYCGSYGNRNFYHYFEDWFSGITKEGEVIWYEMESPRYLMTQKELKYYDLEKGDYSSESILEGEILFFEMKTVTSDDKMCLRTKEDNKKHLDRCVLYRDLKEAEWVWQDMERPRYLEAGAETKKIEMSTNKEGEAPLKRDFYNEKISLPDGKLCLRNKELFEENECVLFSELKDVEFKIYKMMSPRYMTAKDSEVEIIDPIKNSVVKTVEEGENYYFEEKAFTMEGNEMCLIVDTEDGTINCIKYADLVEVWVPMERPRVMKMIKESYKVDATNLKVDKNVLLTFGMERKFVRKRYMPDDTWCLQTEYDFEKETNNCIRYIELGEV